MSGDEHKRQRLWPVGTGALLMLAMVLAPFGNCRLLGPLLNYMTSAIRVMPVDVRFFIWQRSGFVLQIVSTALIVLAAATYRPARDS